MTEEQPTIKRCAIYTRKSTDEGLDKEFNSLEAQFDACAAYIRSQTSQGWTLINRHYDDGGFSGGTMKRPAVQVLLKDVMAGEIDVVVVYKIDRISRSLSDFVELSQMFAKRGVGLVSVTQQIDTSTSMGRMIVNLLMSFAQFERETTSDRVRDKLAASRKRGMWTGGVVPFGYKNIDHKLVIDAEKSPQVLFAFQRFALNHSFLQTTREMNEKFGTPDAAMPWTLMRVRCLLNQAIPAGRIKDGKTGELFVGQHEAIVPFDLWQEVQKYIEDNRRGKRERQCAYVAPLKGVIKCGYCGCAMVPTYCTHNGKRTFRYYRCDATHKHLTETCQLKNIAASAIENPVFDLIQRLITSEFFYQLMTDDPEQLQILRRIGQNKADVIKFMTDEERYRLVQLFIRSISVRRDGIDLVVRGDSFKNLMEKGKANENTAT